MQGSIVPYQVKHKRELLDIFQLNVPTAFAQQERKDYELFLQEMPLRYFVYVSMQGKVLAAAGLSLNTSTNIAVLAWDLIHPHYQRQGIGGAMVQHRKVVAQSERMERLEVRTSQMAYAFYEHVGFTLDYIKKDYWAPRYHLYHMSMLLDI